MISKKMTLDEIKIYSDQLRKHNSLGIRDKIPMKANDFGKLSIGFVNLVMISLCISDVPGNDDCCFVLFTEESPDLDLIDYSKKVRMIINPSMATIRNYCPLTYMSMKMDISSKISGVIECGESLEHFYSEVESTYSEFSRKILIKMNDKTAIDY